MKQGKLRVLHIWNTAGVASVIAKFQKKLLGWDTWVITRKEKDKFGLTTYGYADNSRASIFFLRVFLISRKYDIIHVHSLDVIVPYLKLLYPRKPIVLSYHGSEIRNKWESRKKYWKKTDLITVSTKDLLKGAPSSVVYLPNPVDTELFKPLNLKRMHKGLLIIKSRRSSLLGKIKEIADRYAETYGIEYDLIMADKNPIPYKDMPLVLNRYEYYIDIPHGYTEADVGIPALSKTALEALACGTKVIRWDGKLVTSLPREHRPEYVVEKLMKLYMSLLNK